MGLKLYELKGTEVLVTEWELRLLLNADTVQS